MIGRILHWVYCLDLPDAALLVLLCSTVFLVIKAYLGNKRWWKPILGILLVAAVAAIVYVTIGNRTHGDVTEPMLVSFHSYREAASTGNIEIYRSNFMNVLLFYPAGLLLASLLPKRWHPVWRILLVTAVFAALSAGIEYTQYVYVLGRVEIDDVIHNTFGALLGSAVGSVQLNITLKR